MTNPTPQRNDEYDEIHGIASPNPEHLCTQFCQIHNSPANPTPQSGWEETMYTLIQEVVDGNDPDRILEYVRSLLKEDTAATEKAFGGCTNCYGKGYHTRKAGAGTSRISWPINPYLPCERCDRGK